MPRAASAPSPARIIRDPRICGGEPTLAGTRVPVSAIVIQWRFSQDLQQIRNAFPHLDIPSIQKALRYYERHRSEIDQLIEEQEQAAYSVD
jgi:uncharacterized protein (DUF433 family)